MAEHKNDLEHLTQSQRLNLAIACIDDSLARLDSANARSGLAEARKLIASVWGMIWQVNEVRELERETVCGLVSDLETCATTSTVPAVYDLALSIITVLKRTGESLSKKDVLHALSYAYQVVLHEEVLAHLVRNATESEVRSIEETNPICIHTISSQLSYLAKVREGNRLHRRWFP